MPCEGDFVARSLDTARRTALDRWLTKWLAPEAEWPGHWPPEGLRGVINPGSGRIAILVLPSQDSAGRVFPLAAVVSVDMVDRKSVDDWAERVIWPLDEAAAGELTPDELARRLGKVEDPAVSETVLLDALWSEQHAPEAPETALVQHFRRDT